MSCSNHIGAGPRATPVFHDGPRESASSRMTRISIAPTYGRPSGWSRTACASTASSSNTTSSATIKSSSRSRIGVAETAMEGPGETATKSGAGPTNTTCLRPRAGPVPRLPDRLFVARRPARYRGRRGPDAPLSGRTRSGKVQAGFTRFRARGGRAGGRTGRGSKFDPGLAEEILR